MVRPVGECATATKIPSVTPSPESVCASQGGGARSVLAKVKVMTPSSPCEYSLLGSKCFKTLSPTEGDTQQVIGTEVGTTLNCASAGVTVL